MSDHSFDAFLLSGNRRLLHRLTARKLQLAAALLDTLLVGGMVALSAARHAAFGEVSLPVEGLEPQLRWSGMFPTWLIDFPTFLASCPAGALAGALYLPALYLARTYTLSALLKPIHAAFRIVALWIGCLGAVLGILSAGDPASIPSLLHATDAGFPLAVLVSRGMIATFAGSCGHAERWGSVRTLLVVETGCSAPLACAGPQADERSTFPVTSFSEASAPAVEQLVAAAHKLGSGEIRLVLGASALADCETLCTALRKTELGVEICSAVAQPMLDGCPVHQSSAGFVYRLQRAPLDEHARSAKRAVDFWGAAALCLALAPLLLLIAAMVKATSAGPVLFRQTRTGLNGQTFTILKFRTMSAQENGETVVQAVRGDVRVTKLGRWLRFLSFDELPQLLNVLKGDMSLIGPRPHALAHDRMFAASVPFYEHRFRMKPGITGLAQISGFRGETSTADAILSRVALDLAYVEGWSFSGDMHILFRTLAAVIIPRNAY